MIRYLFVALAALCAAPAAAQSYPEKTVRVKQRLTAQGFDSVGNTPDEFVQVIRRDLARWQKVVAAAKLKGE
jgi:hypothetical protein